MKTISCLTLLTVIVLLIACDEKSFDDLDNPEISNEQSCTILEESQIITKQIYSPALDGNLLGDPATRNVNIYLPKGYDTHPSKKLPVIYCLPGQPSGAEGLMHEAPYEIMKAIAGLQESVDFPAEGFQNWLDQLMESGSVKQAIIVMPDATNKFGFSFYSNSLANGNYEDYIARDLVRYIDTHFNTIKNRKGRAILGHCMGGYGALRIAMNYPQVFSQVAGLSPAHFPDQTVLFSASFMLVEDEMWGFPGPVTPYSIFAPYKFINNTIYGASAAWLCNPNNEPYFLELPFSYSEDNVPHLNEDLMKIWNQNGLISLSKTYADNLKRMNHIFIDCGIYDELMMTEPNKALHQVLEQLCISHEFELFEGYHISNVFDRLEKNLIKLSEGLAESNNNSMHNRNGVN